MEREPSTLKERVAYRIMGTKGDQFDKPMSFVEYFKFTKGKCPGCHGRGRVTVPGEVCDPVEGYKNAERIDCPACKGTGEMSDEVLMKNFNAYRERFGKGLEQFKDEKASIMFTLHKLNDRDALNLKLITQSEVAEWIESYGDFRYADE